MLSGPGWGSEAAPHGRGWGVLGAGSVVAGYRVERLLGVGGMGAVYVVANPELPRRDALKVLSAELSHNDEFRARFVREADVASMLDHPNIVSIYRRGQTENGLLWIAMQFVDGVDADGALKAGTMTPARAVHIVGEVAKALDYAHAHQVVHRDVKPANFLLSGPVGPEERVLLGDFGIARALDDAGLTATGVLVATIAYAAPEVLAGGGFDARADLYSLGCTLYRMLTGKTPYSTANGMAAVMMAHLHAPPPRVSDQAAGLPPALDAVIAKAMAKDPAQRFSSARELADAAASVLHDRAAPMTMPWGPIPAAAVSSYPDPQATGSQWSPSGGGPPTQAALAGAPTQWGAPGFPPAPFPVKQRRRRRTLILVALAAVVVLTGAAVSAITLGHRSDEHPKPAASSAATTTSSTSSNPPVPPSPLPPTVLDGLLLTPEQVAAIMGAPKLAVFKSLPSLIDDSAIIAQKNCIGAYAPAQHEVYAHTGWNVAQAQAIHEPGDVPVGFEIVQAVIQFPTSAAAQKLLADQTAEWSACSGTGFTLNYPNTPPQDWVFGPLTKAEAVISMSQIFKGPQVQQIGECQRALAVRNNVAADVWACRLDITNQAVDLANATIAKLPQ